MPTLKHGHVWWTELMNHDADGARKFYSKLLGWKPHVASMADMSKPAKKGEPSYTMFMDGETSVTGCMQLDGPEHTGTPTHWFTHFCVDDVDKAAKQVTKLGGKLVNGPWDIPTVGRVAIVQDPAGAMFGIGTPVAMQRAAAKKAAVKAPTKVAGKAPAKAAASAKAKPATKSTPAPAKAAKAPKPAAKPATASSTKRS